MGDAQLLAQIADVVVDTAIKGRNWPSETDFGDLIARDHFAIRLHQQKKNLELRSSQKHFVPTLKDSSGGRVYFDVAYPDGL